MGKINLLVGNIVSDEILKCHNVIVNPTNPRMVAGAGVSGEIFKKAGVDKLERYTQARFKTDMKVGEVRITNGFDLGMDIIFVQGPKAYECNNSITPLLETYQNLLNEIEFQGYKNVVMPSLGTGTYGYNHNETAKEVMSLIKVFISDKQINITYVLFDESTKSIYEQFL